MPLSTEEALGVPKLQRHISSHHYSHLLEGGRTHKKDVWYCTRRCITPQAKVELYYIDTEGEHTVIEIKGIAATILEQYLKHIQST